MASTRSAGPAFSSVTYGTPVFETVFTGVGAERSAATRRMVGMCGTLAQPAAVRPGGACVDSRHGQLETEGGGTAEHPQGGERGAAEEDDRATAEEDPDCARASGEQGQAAGAPGSLVDADDRFAVQRSVDDVLVDR